MTATTTPSEPSRVKRKALAIVAAVSLVAGVGLMALAVSAPTATDIASICATPKRLSITSGGTYTGNYCSNDTTPAVTINTNQPVTLDGVIVAGFGNLIESRTAGANITVKNSYGKGRWTDTACGRNGRMVFVANGASSVVLENNEVRTAGLAKVIGGSPTIRIRYNVAREILGESQNCGGFLQFVQFDGVRSANAEVSWNDVRNTPENSRTEDVISLFNSGGTDDAHRFTVANNLIWGSFPTKITDGHSGGGIMLGDRGANSRWTLSENNVILGTTNYGISVVCGQDQTHRGNRVINSGKTPDGRWLSAVNVGISLGSEQHWGVTCANYANNKVIDNTVGWQKQSGRNDTWTPACQNDPVIYDGGNECIRTVTFKPGQTIAYADEQAEAVAWEQRVVAAGIQLGRQGNATPNPSPTTTTTAAPGSTTTTTTANPPVAGQVWKAFNIGGNAITAGGVNYEACVTGCTDVTITRNGVFAAQGVTLNPATDAATASMIKDSAFGSPNGTALKVAVANVPNERFLVSFHVWEDTANSPQTFSATLNGTQVAKDVSSGQQGEWRLMGPYSVDVTNGKIDLAFTGGDINLSSLIIRKAGEGPIPSTTTTSTTSTIPPTTTTTAPPTTTTTVPPSTTTTTAPPTTTTTAPPPATCGVYVPFQDTTWCTGNVADPAGGVYIPWLDVTIFSGNRSGS